MPALATPLRSPAVAAPVIQPALKVARRNDAAEQQAVRQADWVMRSDVSQSTGMVPVTEDIRQIQMLPMGGEHQPPPLTMEKDRSVQADRSAEAAAELQPEPSARFIEMNLPRAGSGNPLPGSTRSFMEARFGRSFENVRVHTDTRAAAMAESIGAKAFTYGQHIYFNRGYYEPETQSGKTLIAHELTHTIQQGSKNPKTVAEGVVQPNIFRRAAAAVGRGLRRAAEWVGDSLSAGLNWLKGRLSGMVSALPGYGLMTVFLGRDPISGQTVARNGYNFIYHGLEIIPFGRQFRQKLEEEGALPEAAAFVDAELLKLNLSADDIKARFSRFWNSLTLSDIGSPGDVFDRLINLFSDPVSRLVTFAENLAVKFLEIVKNYLLSKLREWAVNRESPTWYPLITVILGYDPIMGEAVERNGVNILNGFIRLHPQGDEQLARMQETGSFDRAAAWIDSALSRLSRIVSGIRDAIRLIWESVTSITSLMNPVGVFSNIWNAFRAPLADLAAFALEVAGMILQYVKDALLGWLSRTARETWGYPLLTVLLGKDPFTDEAVPRTARNIIRGFILLLPGGEQKFSQLEETGAIQRMLSWIESAVASLNITLSYILGLFTGLWHSLSIRDLASPLSVFGRIVATFAEPIARIIAFIFEVIKALVMFALEVMNFPFDTVRSIVSNTMQAYNDIKNDPIGFFLNMVRAVKQGFVQFFDNFTGHLLAGVRDWLFGELREAGITPPQDLSFRSILGFVLEVLGITLSNIWERLAERIGPERAQQIRSVIDRATGAWAFIKDVYERGPVAIWEYIQGKISNLWEMITGFVREWVMTRIIERVTTRLLSMLDPTGIMAVVNSFIAFFRAVQSFIEKLREILEIINSFVAGVANIARGVLTTAANYLEIALSAGVPVAISFLANQVGLRGLGRFIGEMIERARGYVNQAIDWLIDRALAAGSALLEMGRSALSSIKSWWQQKVTFTAADGHRHSIYFRGDEQNARLVIASRETNFRAFVESLSGNQALKDQALAIAGNIDTEKAKRIDRSKTKEQQKRDEKNKADEIEKHLNALRPIVLELINGENAPPKKYEEKLGTKADGFGTFMEISQLHHTNKGNGSAPSQAAHPVYDDLNLRKTSTGASYYIRGHLRNQQLGGPGSWDNMIPLSRSGNAQHESKVENAVKRALDAGSVVSYKLELSETKYTANEQNLIQDIKQQNTDPQVAGDKEKIVKAEAKVVTAMTATAHIQKKSDNEKWTDDKAIVSQKKVDNVVERTSNSYFLDSEPRVEKVNINTETDRNKIKAATGFDDLVIDKLLRNPRPRFYRYAAMADELGITAAKAQELRESKAVTLGRETTSTL